MVSIEDIKKLRGETGLSVGQCKSALEESFGDFDKARESLKQKGTLIAAKKSDRELGAGIVKAYVHSTGDMGAMIELLCETDFVAKNEEFGSLAYDIAMQCMALKPRFVTRAQVPEEEMLKMREELLVEVKDKPKELQEKIIEGQIDSRIKEFVLVEQSSIKDDSVTIKDLINAAVHKFGERIEIGNMYISSLR